MCQRVVSRDNFVQMLVTKITRENPEVRSDTREGREERGEREDREEGEDKEQDVPKMS